MSSKSFNIWEMIPKTIQYRTNPYKFMIDEALEKALDQYCQWMVLTSSFKLLRIQLFSLKLVSRIKHVSRRENIACIETITNAIALNYETINALVYSGISKISISTGALQKDLYENYRNAFYEKVLESIGFLLKITQEAGNLKKSQYR